MNLKRAGIRLCAFAGTAWIASAVTVEDYPRAFVPDPLRFEAEIQKLTADDNGPSGPDSGAIACVGSSSMRMWHSRIARDLDGLTVIPRGFGGSHFSDLIYWAPKLILDYAPRAVLVYEGDNDTNAGKEPERIAEDLQFLVALCRSAQPDLRFYVVSIKPSLSRMSVWEQAQEANDRMRAYCEHTPGMVYIDVTQALLDEDGKPRNDIFREDDLHLNDKGYDLWSKAIAEVLVAREIGFEKN